MEGIQGMQTMPNVLDSPATRLAQEAERLRIARELHDGVVQSLTALVTDLEYFRTRRLATTGELSSEVIAKVEMWQELARDSLISMRQALGGLRGHTGETDLDFGLESAIQKLLTELSNAGYHVVYDCSEWPPLLPSEYTSDLYYVVREALTNICKHARASTIKVFMFSYEDHLHISIADDGVGMVTSPAIIVDDSGYHQGLIGLRERVALLGGQVSIESAPGKGTRIDVDVPLRREEPTVPRPTRSAPRHPPDF